MSTDDFDAVFGGHGAQGPSFVERFAKPAATVTTPEPGEPPAESGAYKPFGCLPAGVGECCDVQRWVDGTEIAEGIEFQYRFLMQIGYVGEEQIKLFLPDCMVVIEGQRLRELRKKLARRQVTYVQQYSPQVWPAPPAGAPIVTSIAVVRPGREAAGHRGS